MNKVRAYFQRHPFVHWLMSVVVTFTVTATYGLLVHEKDWTFLIGLSAIVPTTLAVTRAVARR